MTLVLDAGPLVAFADASDPYNGQVEQLLGSAAEPLIVPAPVTAEIDYLLGRRLGDVPRRNFIADLAAGRFTVACLEREDYATIGELEARYADLGLGLADCSLIAIANRHQTNRIVTFDERHFRAITPLDGGAFTLLPADD